MAEPPSAGAVQERSIRASPLADASSPVGLPGAVRSTVELFAAAGTPSSPLVKDWNLLPPLSTRPAALS